MKVTTLNGLSRIGGEMNGLSRLNGYGEDLMYDDELYEYALDGLSRLNGYDDYDDEYEDDEDLAAEYVLAVAMEDEDALDGIGDWFKKRKEKRKAKKARKAAKKADRRARKERRIARRENRRDNREKKSAMRVRRAEARTQAKEMGQGFFDQIGGAVQNLGLSKKIEAELSDMGIDATPEMVDDLSQQYIDAGGGTGGSQGFDFKKNLPWIIGGTVLVGGGLYLATRKKKK